MVEKDEITLHILRTSRTNPRLLSYSQLFGSFYFNATLVAPPGTGLIAQEKHNQCDTCNKYGFLGWYIVPELYHYRCYRFFVTETRSKRISDIVGFFQKSLEVPIISYADTATLTAQDLIEALKILHHLHHSRYLMTHSIQRYEVLRIFSISRWKKRTRKKRTDIMDIVVENTSSQTDQSMVVCRWHIVTPQGNAINKYHIWGCQQLQYETLAHLQCWNHE